MLHAPPRPSARGRRSRAAALSLCLTCALAATVAIVARPAGVAYAQSKQSVAKLIEKGQQFFDEQRYEESIQTLSAALMRPGTAKNERIEVFKLLAYNYIVLQRNEEADGAVRGLLVLDETFELPETESPRFRDFFKGVREKWEEEGKPGLASEGGAVSGPVVKIKHSAPEQVDPQSTVSLSGQVDDPSGSVSELALFYRSGSKGKFASGKVSYREGKFNAEIPSSVVEPPIVEYYVEARNQDGLPVASRGDAELPLRIAVASESSVVTSPWLWVPVSLAVVAAVVIPVAVVATRKEESEVTVNVFEGGGAPAGLTFRF